MFHGSEQKRPDPDHTVNRGGSCCLLWIGVFLQVNTPRPILCAAAPAWIGPEAGGDHAMTEAPRPNRAGLLAETTAIQAVAFALAAAALIRAAQRHAGHSPSS